jgi:DNA-binding transcriptional regulator LsrR (DeoR family)
MEEKAYNISDAIKVLRKMNISRIDCEEMLKKAIQEGATTIEATTYPYENVTERQVLKKEVWASRN